MALAARLEYRRARMALKTLKPRLAVLNTNRVKVLDTKAGATERIRGSAWMKTRHSVLVAGLFACVDCARVGRDNEIDHDIPLEQGGSNDDSNLKIRCVDCHKAKTAQEGRARLSSR